MKRIIICLLSLLCLVLPGPAHATAPFGLDGTNGGQCPALNRQCSLQGFTTTNDHDIVIVEIYYSTGIVVTSITDTSGLVYVPRAGASVYNLEEWYTKAPTPVSNDVITVTLQGTPVTAWGVAALVFSGINYNQPFDPSPGIPVTASGTTCGGWPTITTTTSENVIIAFGGKNGTVTWTPDVGYNLALPSVTSPFANAEYRFLTSPQTSVLLNFQQSICNSNTIWGIILDSLCSAAACNNGQQPSPNSIPFQSVSGPGGYPIPPQLADQNVLGYVFLLSAAIALSSFEFPKRQKKTPRELRLG